MSQPKPYAFRYDADTSDVEAVRSLVASTGFFTEDEIVVAAELVTERLEKGSASGYEFVFADIASPESRQLAGYACYGPIDLTESSWDLYWIATQPSLQGKGIGRQILAECETAARNLGGSQLIIETGGHESYLPTRSFYLASGYHVVAEIPDYYAKGDSKVYFCKRF